MENNIRNVEEVKEEKVTKLSKVLNFLMICGAVLIGKLFGFLGVGLGVVTIWLCYKIKQSNLSTGLKVIMCILISIIGIISYLLVLSFLVQPEGSFE